MFEKITCSPRDWGLEEINDAIIAVYNSGDVDGSLLSLADFIALCGQLNSL